MVAFGGGLLVADLTIEGQKEQALAEFQRDQRQQHYSEILQQATRLHNAGDASALALNAGLFTSASAGLAGIGVSGGQMDLGAGQLDSKPSVSPNVKDKQLSGYGNQYVVPGFYNDTGADAQLRKGSSWQGAYTALDQAISNAEIASDDRVIALARALRDKYRADYYQSVMKNIDDIVALYPDPKPDKAKLADALVGVPADRLPPTYDPGILSKSTDELTAMYADAAKRNLGIVDELVS